MIQIPDAPPAARGRCPDCRRLFAVNRFGEHAGRLRRHANLFADGIPCPGSHGEPMPAPCPPPPMPAIRDIRPGDVEDSFGGWVEDHWEAIRWFLENHEAVREAMAGREAVAC